MRKLCELIKKNKSIVFYAIFGVLTTIVNYLVYFPLLYIAGFTAVLSNSIAWFFAVLFSFFTNKLFVFNSKDWSLKNLVHELTWFVGCRLLTGVLETIVLFICVDILDLNGFIWKLLVSVGVVILNYITSRIVVFRKK